MASNDSLEDLSTDSRSSTDESSCSHSSEAMILSYDSSSLEGPESSSDEDGATAVHPYMYEPLASASSGTEDEDSDHSDDSDPRLSNTYWCTCGHCSIMPTGRECRCCSEIGQVMVIRSAEGVGCITVHPGFQSVCLNPWVLQTAYFTYRQHYGENAIEGSLQEKYRHVAYRQLTRWCWQWLGRSVRVILPACAVKKIRETFSSTDGTYTGFNFPPLS